MTVCDQLASVSRDAAQQVIDDGLPVLTSGGLRMR